LLDLRLSPSQRARASQNHDLSMVDTRGALAIAGFLAETAPKISYPNTGSDLEDLTHQLERVAEARREQSQIGSGVFGVVDGALVYRRLCSHGGLERGAWPGPQARGQFRERRHSPQFFGNVEAVLRECPNTRSAWSLGTFARLVNDRAVRRKSCKVQRGIGSRPFCFRTLAISESSALFALEKPLNGRTPFVVEKTNHEFPLKLSGFGPISSRDALVIGMT
jgi:hypothetical protein